MEVAATGIFQVTEVELKHLFFQFTELDTGFLNKRLVDLLDLLCNGNRAKQKTQL